MNWFRGGLNAFHSKSIAGILFAFLTIVPAVQTWAVQHALTSADLPYTAVTSDTITISGTKITSTGNGIIIGVSNVLVDLKSDTLVFGSGYGDNYRGISITYGSNVVIRGDSTLVGSEYKATGWVYHGGGAADSAGVHYKSTTNSSWDNVALYISASGAKVSNVNTYVTGWDAHCIRHAGGTGVEISVGRHICHGYGFIQRDMFDGIAFLLAGAPTSAPNKTATIHDLTIDSWGGGMAQQGGNNVYDIYSCSLLVDARQDLYEYPSGNMMWGTANTGGIQFWAPGAGTKFHGNVILTGQTYTGADIGINISYGAGTAAYPIEFYNNYIYVHKGQDDAYGGLTAKPIKERWGNKHIIWRGNTLICEACTNASVLQATYPGANPDAWGSTCEGIDIIFTSANYGSEGAALDSFITFENNRVFATALHAGLTAAGMRLTIRGENDIPIYSFAGAGNTFRNNYFQSTTVGLDMGKSDGGSCQSLFLEGDTIASDASSTSDYNTYEIGYGYPGPVWGGIGTNNIARDMVYLGRAAESDVTWGQTGGTPHADIRFQRTLNVYVKGSNGLPVKDAIVTVRSNYSQTQWIDTTNGNGLASGITEYRRVFYTGSPDSTAFNPFSIKVKLGSDSTTSSLTVSSGSGPATQVMNLQNTLGAEPGGDTIPPGEIRDLSVIEQDGQSVTLSWTAPGDDLDEGFASAYDIRHYTQYIVPSNWDQADQVASPPLPSSPNSEQTVTIDNLATGTTHFFCVRTRDEADNWSGLSNVAATDGVAPAAVSDLNAFTGVGVGEIILTWTATGDDGASGTAAAYEIRYSPVAITEGNWSAATQSPDTPNPRSSGSGMSLVLSDLTPGGTYYVGLKATDETGNVSALSNTPSAEARLDLALSGGDTIIIASPACGANVAGLFPTLSVYNIDPLSPRVYSFLLAADSTFANIVSSGSVNQGDGETSSWHVPVQLTPNVTYWWYVGSDSGDTSPISYFSTQESGTYVYPNPYSPTAGQPATFIGLPANSNLTLMTVSGNLVRRWTGIQQGSVTWDGSNGSGDDVAPGVYLWYVENSDAHGKIVVK